MSISEASYFFDEHDIFSIGAVSEAVDIKFSLQKKICRT